MEDSSYTEAELAFWEDLDETIKEIMSINHANILLNAEYGKIYDAMGDSLSKTTLFELVEPMLENVRLQISNNSKMSKLLEEVEQNLKNYTGRKASEYVDKIEYSSILLKIVEKEKNLNLQKIELLNRLKEIKEEKII